MLMKWKYTFHVLILLLIVSLSLSAQNQVPKPSPDFPDYLNTGNPSADKQKYVEAKQAWIKQHPEIEKDKIIEYETNGRYKSGAFVPEPKVTPTYYTDLNVALQHPEQVHSLNLQNKNLKVFPKEIIGLSKLEVLDISNNQLTSIPDEIADLPALKELYINKNQITRLEAGIFRNRALRVLQAEDNPLEFISPAIKNLSSLEQLWFSDVKSASVLVPEIWQLQSLRNLKLIRCQLFEIPKSIQNLKNLQVFCVNQNNIKELPDELFGLGEMTYLSFGVNPVNVLSDKVARLTKLNFIGIFYTNISIASKQLSSIKALRHISVLKAPLSQGELNKLKEDHPDATIYLKESEYR